MSNTCICGRAGPSVHLSEGSRPPSAGESEFKSAWTPFDVRRLFALFRPFEVTESSRTMITRRSCQGAGKNAARGILFTKGTFTSIPLESLCSRCAFAQEFPRYRGSGSLPLRRGGRGSFLQQLRPGATTNISFLELHCKHRDRTNLHPAPQTCGRNPCSVAADRRDSEWFRPAVKPCEPSALR